jgi:hypothetical protein
MTTDEQEALSRKYSNDLILLLPLKSGNIAVFNTARELTGIAVPFQGSITMAELATQWLPPEIPEQLTITLSHDDETIEALRRLGLL